MRIPVLPEGYRILFRENKIIMKILVRAVFPQGFWYCGFAFGAGGVIFPGVAKPKTAAADAADSTLVAAKDSAASVLLLM